MTQPEQAAREHLSAVDREYGTYVAVEAIDIGGARAFNAGDPVPVSHVEREVVTKDQVVKRGTKAAEKLEQGSI